jgi:membrane protease YdiL (CAAX protease family)
MATVYLVAFMFGPAVGAVTCSLAFDRGRRLEALSLWPIRWKKVLAWTLVGWALAAGLCILGLAATLLTSGAPPADAAARLAESVRAAGVEELPLPAETLLLLTVTVNVPVGIVLNTLLITANEELGWRGWLQPRLAHLGFWPMVLLTGVIWGVWHAPVVWMGHNYPGMGWTGVALMVVFTLGLTPYVALTRERSGHVLPAGAFHGAMNAVAGVTLLFAPDPTWPTNGILGAAGFAVLYAGWIGVALVRRDRTAADHGPPDATDRSQRET